MKRQGLIFAGLFVMAMAAQARAAEVHINVNIGAPPPIVVRSAPNLVYLAEPAVYVAVGVPYDLYFVSGRYYAYHGNDWFWASRYGGPWNRVSYVSLPPGLRKFKVARLHEFRDREYREYVSHRDSHDRGNGHGNGRGNGHGRH